MQTAKYPATVHGNRRALRLLQPPGRLAVILLLLMGLNGCAIHRPPVLSSQLGPQAEPVELRDTVFFPQKTFQCGPAALATVLNAADVAVHPDELTPQVYLPERHGSLQLELLAATRRHQRLPYRINGTLEHLAAQLRAGHPVLVLQNTGFRILPVWHYAVVIGLDPSSDEVILRSGTERRLVMDADDFLESWEMGGYWGVVALRPGVLPAQPKSMDYLSVVADMEAVGHHKAALASYEAAATRWPDLVEAQFGAANTLYALGRVPEAKALYRDILTRWPTHAPALNNLALLLAENGCRDHGLALLDQALHEHTGAFSEPLLQTRREIAAMKEDPDGICRE